MSITAVGSSAQTPPAMTFPPPKKPDLLTIREADAQAAKAQAAKAQAAKAELSRQQAAEMAVGEVDYPTPALFPHAEPTGSGPHPPLPSPAGARPQDGAAARPLSSSQTAENVEKQKKEKAVEKLPPLKGISVRDFQILLGALPIEAAYLPPTEGGYQDLLTEAPPTVNTLV
jgi:hypothetical protein